MTSAGEGGAALIWCPFPDQATARSVAQTLLAEGLVACMNIIPGIESHFLWQGRVEQADEVAALGKTSADLLERAMARLAALHPYDTPAIAGWRADAAAPATLAWLDQALAAPEVRR